MRLPPSSQSCASPNPQNPSASSHEIALNVKPSYTSAEVDVGRAQIGAGPEVRGLAEHLRLVGERALVPRDPLDDLGADRLDPDRRMRQVAGDRRVRDDDRDRRVARHVAVVQPERGS